MVTETATGLRIAVRVQPRAARNRVVGLHGAALRVQVTAPPVDDAANEAVIGLLAEWLALPRRAVRITHGKRTRDKLIEVTCDQPAMLADRIRRLLARCVDKDGGRD
jgi:uncharacterized protein (TIGR00251 family)